ncbi:DUF4147 domain-containing protein [Agreia sp. VKM Ac-1783]|uniref:glycerate kinase type-2 family protein n=1 Tax=Agreia sp. VKM Ac-1783 TaxID=1938889 RepID=UPI000A2ACA25|nr:DUF4147 domain-containing protein [Agreia sp. VKM Ac-1783]SMQ74226.1 Glycerate-2-kinase [Agreia sp. VKM Ac-1783]
MTNIAKIAPKIQNEAEILEHGDKVSRGLVLDITNDTLQGLDSYTRIRSIAHMVGSILHIGEKSWDLAHRSNIYLVGAGKACNHMALAMEDVLGGYLTRGIAIVKIRESRDDAFVRTELHVGGHPLPNDEGHQASLEILELVDSCGPDDLVIAVISGGSSSLMSCPVPGISLDDERATTDTLLKSGAGIYEINAVRRHISQTNGGRLAQRIAQTGAELIGIGISDAVGKPPTDNIRQPSLTYTSTPIGPDKTTLEDARQCIVKYQLADRLPRTVVDYLMNADDSSETPKAFPDNTYFVINTLPDASLLAERGASQRGYPALTLTYYLEGEAKEAGRFLASVARQIQQHATPISAPCFILAAGEVTTTIAESDPLEGTGGPGHELAVGFALDAAAIPGACLISIDTEGTDGTAEAAGAITDSTTVQRATANGVDLHHSLRTHGTHEALASIGDVVVTGNTGTNLCDLHIIYVPALSESMGN